MATIGRLAVLIDADSTGLKAGLKGAVNDTEESSKKIIKNVQAIATAFVGYLSVDMFAGMIKGAAEAGRQIDQLSRLSGASAEAFQRQTYAAQQFGISNEKLADIFKDVQDKAGQFLRDGGGPMQTFFEQIAPKVGVTADQFRNLGGPDALQLYVSSLEKANLSQNEMVAYMEELASDSALLLPLLRNNGKAMKEMGDEAQRLGAVLSDETIRANKEFAAQIDRLDASLTSLKMNIGSAVIPEITRLIDEFNTGIKIAGGFMAALKLFGTSKPFDNPATGAKHYREELEKLTDQRNRLMEAEGVMANTSGFDRDIEAAKKLLQYHETLMKNQWRLSGDRMGMNDPRVIGTPAASETAGFRPAGAAAPVEDKTAAKAAEDAMKKAQEVEAFFAQIGEQTRQREVNGLQTFVDGLRLREEARIQAGMNEQALAEEAYQTEYEKLLESKEILALTEEEFTERLLQIRMDRDERIADADSAMLTREQELADERFRIQKAGADAELQMRERNTNALIGLLSQLGAKNKVFAVASIALQTATAFTQNKVATASAAMLAYRTTLLTGAPPPVALAAYKATLALGAGTGAMILAGGAIQAAGAIGSGGGSSASSVASSGVSSAGSIGQGGPVMNQTITIQGVSTGDLFSGDAVRTLIDRLIDAQRNGARIVLA